MYVPADCESSVTAPEVRSLSGVINGGGGGTRGSRSGRTGSAADSTLSTLATSARSAAEQLECLLANVTYARRDLVEGGTRRRALGRLVEDLATATSSTYASFIVIEPDEQGRPVPNRASDADLNSPGEGGRYHTTTAAHAHMMELVKGRIDSIVAAGGGPDELCSTWALASPEAADQLGPLNSFIGMPVACVEGGTPLAVIALADHPAGYCVTLSDELMPFLDATGDLLARTSTEAERRSLEALHDRTEATNEAILEAVSDAVIVIDENGKISTFNKAAEMIFGYETEDVVGRNVSMLMPQPYSAAHDGYMARYAETGERRIIGKRRELEGRRKDGSVFPLELTVAEVQINGRRLYAGTCRDVTLKLAAQRNLTMYATTIDATPDFVSVSDPAGRVLAINPAGRRLIGIGPDEPLEGMELGDLHSPESRVLLREEGLPVAVAGGVWRSETCFVSRDGTQTPMSEVVAVSRNLDGEIQHICTIARDISGLKEIELVKAEFVEFVSTVSHELRTPLTSIRGALGLLTGRVLRDLDGDAGDILLLAQSNTDRVIRLVNDILDFEKAQMNQLDIRWDELDATEVGQTAIDTVSGAALEREVELALEVSPSVKMFNGDAIRLAQVLVNLIGNAVKFSPVGETVTLAIGDVDANTIEFRVIDRGPGIPPGALDAIFEPFYQVDSTDRRKVGGTGLGLAIAQGIVAAHHGTLEVESVPEQGATFIVKIPRVASMAPELLSQTAEPQD